MKTIGEIIQFMEEHVIECPVGMCGRCDDARECVKSLKYIEEHTDIPDYKDFKDTQDSNAAWLKGGVA